MDGTLLLVGIGILLLFMFKQEKKGIISYTTGTDNGETIYFINNAFYNWYRGFSTHYNYTNELIELLGLFTKQMKNQYSDFEGFLVSSTIREIKIGEKPSPHNTGRAIDISGYKQNGEWRYLYKDKDTSEAHFFYDLCISAYNQGLLNQMITPFHCIDDWNDEDTKKELIDTHQNHVHIGVSR